MKRSTIVLIHGWCADETVWREQTRDPRFAGKVIALDLPGHGAAARNGGSTEISIAECASHVVRIVDQAAGHRVVLVGHSMGGPVALEAAIALEDRCELLVGVDTFTDRRFYASRPAEEIDRRLAGFATDFEGELRAMVERIVAPHVSTELRAEIAALMVKTPKANALAALRSLLSYDIGARWPLLRSPAVAINAQHLADPVADLVLPGLAVHPMADVGHFPMLESPQAFNAILGAILAGDVVSPPPSTAGSR